jgi:hypothetical protein
MYAAKEQTILVNDFILFILEDVEVADYVRNYLVPGKRLDY